MKEFANKKSVWLDALEGMRLRRPIPLAHWEKSSRSASVAVSLERLRDAVIRAAKIERSWSREIVVPTRYEQRTVEMAEGDRLEW